jgi:glycerol-3-phosphate acyltransferase PlsX
MTTVALDAMGGDNAPNAIVQGALIAARDATLEIALIGRVGELRPLLPRMPSNIHLVDAPDAVGMAESPTASMRQKPRSSIMVGLELVREREAAAFISFGNTGAVMATSVRKLGRIAGVSRPAIGALFRNARGSSSLMLDVGASVDCRPSSLVEFATMGKAYFERVLHHHNPGIALLNIGEEPNKGDRFSKEAHALLQRDEPNFVGNVEGNGIFSGAADIIVCDGFVGNAVLKSSEAVAALLSERLGSVVRSKPHYALGGLLLKGAFEELKREMDHRSVGGAPLFGVDGTVLIGHGRADAESVNSGLQLARRVGDSEFVETIRTALAGSATAQRGERRVEHSADDRPVPAPSPSARSD